MSKELGIAICELKPLGEIKHVLTHRRYIFNAFTAAVADEFPVQGLRKWVTLPELAEYPLPKPHLMIAKLLPQCLQSSK
jgi:adenine-specific DNA glycosylase